MEFFCIEATLQSLFTFRHTYIKKPLCLNQTSLLWTAVEHMPRDAEITGSNTAVLFSVSFFLCLYLSVVFQPCSLAQAKLNVHEISNNNP